MSPLDKCFVPYRQASQQTHPPAGCMQPVGVGYLDELACGQLSELLTQPGGT